MRTGQRFDLGSGVYVDALLPAGLSLDQPLAPVAYRLRLGRLAVLLLNREALAGDPAPLLADGACLDALILPSRGDAAAAAALVRLLHPRLVVLPQPVKHARPPNLAPAALAPLPAGTRLWQAAEGRELALDAADGACSGSP